MAQRRTTAQRKSELVRDLRAAIRSGELPPGSALPPLRELGKRHELHHSTVQAELQPLIVEGLLRVEPRLGVFVAGAESDVSLGGYLFVNGAVGPGSYAWSHGQAIRRGFERQITRFGGYTVTIPADEFPIDRNAIPTPVGVFEFLATPDTMGWDVPDGTPVVEYSILGESATSHDLVHFDDFDGGRIATQHLLKQGHQRVAFMAIHSSEPVVSHAWSVQRESGWRDAVSRAFPDQEAVSFHTSNTVAADARKGLIAEGAAREATAREMLARRGEFDAVVGSDDRCITALIDVWREANVPREEWPALVGFEGFQEVENYVLTSVIPPWEKIGEVANA